MFEIIPIYKKDLVDQIKITIFDLYPKVKINNLNLLFYLKKDEFLNWTEGKIDSESLELLSVTNQICEDKIILALHDGCCIHVRSRSTKPVDLSTSELGRTFFENITDFTFEVRLTPGLENSYFDLQLCEVNKITDDGLISILDNPGSPSWIFDKDQALTWNDVKFNENLTKTFYRLWKQYRGDALKGKYDFKDEAPMVSKIIDLTTTSSIVFEESEIDRTEVTSWAFYGVCKTNAIRNYCYNGVDKSFSEYNPILTHNNTMLGMLHTHSYIHVLILYGDSSIPRTVSCVPPLENDQVIIKVISDINSNVYRLEKVAVKKDGIWVLLEDIPYLDDDETWYGKLATEPTLLDEFQNQWGQLWLSDKIAQAPKARI